jgi:septal ring factor EnvC (AmiA/AmiB activator)
MGSARSRSVAVIPSAARDLGGGAPRSRRNAWITALFPYLILSSFSAAAQPVSPQPPSREQELQALRAEIARIEARLGAARERRSGLAGELGRTDLELELQARRIAEAQAARDLAAEQVTAGEAEVARLEEQLAATRRDLRRRLVGLYRLGRQGYLRLLLSLRPAAEVVPAVRWVRYLARRDRAAIDRHTAARERLEEERRTLLARRAELDRWIDQERGRRRELIALRRRQASLLAAAEREGGVLSARAGELEHKVSRLAEFLDLLYGRNPEVLAGRPLQRYKGVLDWPVRGALIAGFGPRLDPRYRTRVPHNGLSLATPPGADVRAVFPGKVLYAAPFEGYGTTVVVHHPGRVFTLYAGLGELRVGQGAMLSLGDVVGLASSKFYFEIRVENRPENPLTWLRSP